MKIIIFGQVAVACFKAEEETDFESFQANQDSVLAEGHVSKMTVKQAQKFCPLHPNFMKYYEYAIMTLWKGKGIFSKGTEDPLRAVKSYFPKDTCYYIAWGPFSE
jgi:hypothetical protein